MVNLKTLILGQKNRFVGDSNTSDVKNLYGKKKRLKN